MGDLYKGAIVKQETTPIYTKSALKYWHDEITLKAKGTQKKNYKDYFQRFLDFIGMTANEVLELRKQDTANPT